MSRHGATVEWDRGEDDFLGGRYGRGHLWRFDGVAMIRASAAPSVVAAPWSEPGAVDPEEAFVAALSSCHMLWFLSLAARRGLVVERYRDRADGVLEAVDGKRRITTVRLRPQVTLAGEGVSDAELAALHEAAHVECYLANSVTCQVLCEPQALASGEAPAVQG